MPGDAGLTIAFTEGWQDQRKRCDPQCNAEGGRQSQSAGMKVDSSSLSPKSGIDSNGSLISKSSCLM